MQVRISGFQLEFSNNINLPEVFHTLESMQGKKISRYKDKYLYYTDVKEGYIVGVVLRFRANKKSISTTTDASGNLILDVTKLGTAEDNTDVSVFSLNPKTLRGVFYQYTGGLSPASLGQIWSQAHDKVKSDKIKTLTLEYSQLGTKDKSMALAKAQQECDGRFLIKVLSTPATLEFILNEFDVIKKLEINTNDALENSGKYAPNSSFIKKAKVDVTFENLSSELRNIKQYIQKVVTDNPTERDIIKIYGDLASAQDKMIYLGENIDEFGSYSFDSYVTLLPEKYWKDYIDCEALNKLLYKMKNAKSIFGVIPTNENWRIPSATTLNKLKKVS